MCPAASPKANPEQLATHPDMRHDRAMIMPRFYAYALFVAATLLASGCASLSPGGGLPETTDARATVVDIAVAQLAAPYKYGGAGRTGFDDSGLVYFCYREAGYQLPREHEGQIRSGQPIQFAEARPGDLLFYRYDDGSENEKDMHVGIYLGNGQMVHSSLKRDEVVSDVVDIPFWFQRLIAVIRILP